MQIEVLATATGLQFPLLIESKLTTVCILLNQWAFKSCETFSLEVRGMHSCSWDTVAFGELWFSEDLWDDHGWI